MMLDFKYDIETGNLLLFDSSRLESLVKNILKKGFKLGDNTIYLRPTYIDMDGNPIQNAGNIYPKTSGTYSLGSSTYKWLNAFLSGYADIGSLRISGTEVLTSGRALQNIASVAQTLLPDADATRDLGSSSYRWRDLRLSRDAHIGGDTFISGVLDNPFVNAYASDYGLVLYLPFEEGTGTVTYDESPYGNDGTIYGATWVDGKYGKALSFDGTDDYIRLTGFQTVYTPITLSAWIYINEAPASWCAIIYKDVDDVSAIQFNPGTTQVRLDLRLADDSTRSSGWTAALPLGEWVHVVATYDGETVAVYVNGALAASTFYAGYKAIRATRHHRRGSHL
ncbi:MAG: LamG domain-containing protein [Candidatus Thorarchaeota archaeon]